MRTRRIDVALAFGAVLAVVGLTAVLLSAGTPDPAPGRRGPITGSAPARPVALFIGDSYTAGAQQHELSPACIAATRRGWLCGLAAFPGTGFISGGPANRFVIDEYHGRSTSYQERIPHLAWTYAPRVVVLDGGRNDVFAPRDDVLKAMAATVDEAHRTWPAASVVLVRPRYLADPQDDLGFDDRFFASLTRRTEAAALLIVDPIDSFVGTDVSGMIGRDGLHPNLQGNRALAAALTAALSAPNLATLG